MSKGNVGVVLVGGPSTTTSFRPLSLAIPSPLIEIAGRPMIEPAIRALASVPNMREIFLIGFFEKHHFDPFCASITEATGVTVRYLFEPKSLGTAGGLHFFSDEIRGKDRGGADHVFVLYGDNFSDFPLCDMLHFHEKHGRFGTVMGTRVTREKAPLYGVLVKDDETDAVVHYAEKPKSFLSDLANCGVYVFTEEIFTMVAEAAAAKPDTPGRKASKDASALRRRYHIDGDIPDGFARLEQDVVQALCGTGKLVVFEHAGRWDAIKTAAMLLEANKAYLEMIKDGNVWSSDSTFVEKVTKSLAPHVPGKIIGNVIIDPSAEVDPSAKIGPNVYIGAGAKIGPGARVRDCILFDGVRLMDNSCVLHSLIGANSVVGAWARIEGIVHQSVRRLDHMCAGNVTVFGEGVRAHSEIVVRGCVVLPNKSLNSSASNEILL